MRILTISDILWRLTSLVELKNLIEKVKPSLVLLAGDLVNDQNNFDIYWKNVYKLLEFLNKCEIQTFFIRGNWDESPYYEGLLKLVIKKLPFIKEISEKVEEFHGLKILGLSHSFTNNLKAIRDLSNKPQEPLDLVLAHSEYKRRIWLFHLNAKLIITGHFDKQLCQIRDKVFISLENFPSQYAVIDYQPTKYKISYFDGDMHKTVIRKAEFSNGKLAWKDKPFRNRRQYANRIENLMAAKTQLMPRNTKSEEIINKLLKCGISKRHIEEYVGAWATKIQMNDDDKLMKELEELGVLEW